MINPKQLLTDLQRLLKRLEADLRQRADEHAETLAHIQNEYAKAKTAGRTSQSFTIWRDEFVTQAAAAWALACVFVRFMEDNGLVETPRLAGAGERLRLARDNHTVYFREHPRETDREYLQFVFRETGKLPGARELFDERHNPLWTLGLSGDGASELLNFWQEVDAQAGGLRYDFRDDEWNTRFLGDLYQDLSEAARKKYALLQTPEFVEEFILERTLTPAIGEFGYATVRLIDPTCGSGHFLLGAFNRLLDLRLTHEAGVNTRELVQRTLNQIYGVDLNPFAISIARFRLLVAALKASDIGRLRDAPAFKINLAAGDSLLHGRRPTLEGATQRDYLDTTLRHVYETEDAEELRRILEPNSYHAVVGNPPYITVKDAALNAAYRERFRSCHMKYSLAVPFMERFFDLAVGNFTAEAQSKAAEQAPTSATLRGEEEHAPHSPAGFVGMITANSFMKREFGKKLIETYIPRWNLTHVIDTSGAYIPGHGTPTVILFGRASRPMAETVRAVMGIKGEPQTPADAAQGLVWRSIVEHVDESGATTEFVSVADVPRASFHRHPWSIGGGGAAELKEQIGDAAEKRLDDLVDSIGFMAITGEDDAFVAPQDFWTRNKTPFVQFGVGDVVRDWQIASDDKVAFMYSEETIALKSLSELGRFEESAWTLRTNLRNRLMFGKLPEESSLSWYEYRFFAKDRYRMQFLITFAEVATHNHFVLGRGGKVFKQTAPVIKLPSGASEDDHLALLGLLNSSTACFWMKQVFQNKGSTVDDKGARQTTSPFENFYQHSGTGLKQFPIPQTRPLELARELDRLAGELQANTPASLAAASTPGRDEWQRAAAAHAATLARMIALQEELDWECYRHYGLVGEEDFHRRGAEPSRRDDAEKNNQSSAETPRNLRASAVNSDAPSIQLGQRAFEIVMARRMEEGELQTTWFARHNSVPVTELPADWPDDYRHLVERRIELIESDPSIRLIEQPEYKRRWNTESWHAQSQRALREWLLNRLESPAYWPTVALSSVAKLADRARADRELMGVAEMYRGRSDFDSLELIKELVRAEAVPFLPVLRYKRSGMEKREEWERTWAMQREEDKLREAFTAETGSKAAEKAQSSATLRGSAPRLRGEEEALKNLIHEQIGDIPPPPKYKATDFQDTNFWRLRGKLDVPKERFISYPGLERDADRSLPLAWAGFDHLQQAQALAAFYTNAKDTEGWTTARLLPVLAGIVELLPWLRQWHNAPDPVYNLRMGDYFTDFVDDEARALGVTVENIREWKL